MAIDLKYATELLDRGRRPTSSNFITGRSAAANMMRAKERFTVSCYKPKWSKRPRYTDPVDPARTASVSVLYRVRVTPRGARI